VKRIYDEINIWVDRLVSSTGLEPEDVLLDIRLGVSDALDGLCPSD
jgi:hypothetical protein